MCNTHSIFAKTQEGSLSIKILTAPPAGGKTTYCIEAIHQVRRQDPLAQIKVIVPDKQQMAYWKKRLALSSLSGRFSGFIGTDVTSFSRLAMNILEISGSSRRTIPGRLDMLCIKEAVSSASKKEPLAYFSPIRTKPGMTEVIAKAVHKLQRGCVLPEAFREESQGDPKISDTARIYREYLDLLDRNGWVGAAGLLNAAADILENKHIPSLHIPLLVVDGFDELTNDCLRLIRALEQCCGDILITFPVYSASKRTADLRMEKEAERIKAALNASIHKIREFDPPIPGRILAKKVLLAGVSENDKLPADDNFLLISTSSQTSEVREALRELKARIIRGVCSPGECAVFVPDIQTYFPILRQLGKEMGIPIRFAQNIPLAAAPASSVLRRLLHLASDDFRTEDVLSVLRSPFLKGCPDPDESDRESFEMDLYIMDRAARESKIISGIGEWQDALNQMENSARDERTDRKADADEDDPQYKFPAPEKIHRILDSFVTFSEILTAPDGQRSRSEWAVWLRELLGKIHYFECIEDRKGFSFENGLDTLLKRMVYCEEKMDLPPIAYQDFLTEFENDLDSAIQSETSAAADHVFAGSIMNTAGCRWKLVVLTGFSEGLFPGGKDEPLILSDALRDKLGIPAEKEQSTALLHALTRADRVLIITRPEKTDKGEEWPPSIYWQSICKLASSGKRLHAAASAEELGFRIMRRQESLPDTMGEMKEKLDELAKANARVLQQDEGIYGSVPDPDLKEALEKPDLDKTIFSCSAIETFLNCPFRYFLVKILGLEPPPEPGTGMDAAQTGTLNHKVLELTFPPGTVYSSAEKAVEAAEKVIPQVLAIAPRQFGFRESEFWEYEKGQIYDRLIETIKKMFRDSSLPMNQHWSSAGTEVPFGYPDKDPEHPDPLKIQTENGELKIRGWIDRLDISDDGLLRVVDYKTGQTGFSPAELEKGSHIQAGVYAAAAVLALQKGTHCEGMYWSVNSRKSWKTEEYDVNDEEIPGISFLERFAEGIQTASYPALQSGKSCPDYCPGASWCRKYVRTEKYG